MDEIKTTFKRADKDDLGMWCGWEKRGNLRKCYTQRWKENDREKAQNQMNIQMRGEKLEFKKWHSKENYDGLDKWCGWDKRGYLNK